MMRYFGGSYRSYFIKVDKKVAQLINSSIYRKDAKNTNYTSKNVVITKIK